MKKQPKRRTIAGQEVMDIATLAARFGTSQRAIRARVNRGTIPFRRWQGRIIFLRGEVDAFLEGLAGCDVQDARKNLEARQS